MKRLFSFKGFLFELISVLFLSVMIFVYPDIGVANLYLIVSLVFVQYLLLSLSRQLRLLSILLFVLSILFYKLFIWQNIEFVLVVFIVLLILLSAYYVFKYGINNDQRNITFKTLIFGVIIAVLLPAFFYLSMSWLNKGYSSSLSESSSEIIAQVKEGELKQLEESDKLSKDQFVAELYNAGRLLDLSEYLQNVMVMGGMDLIVVCNNENKVVARSDEPKLIGMDCQKIMPGWQNLASKSGIIRERDTLFLAASAKIEEAGKESRAQIITARELRNFITDRNDFRDTNIYFGIDGKILNEEKLKLTDTFLSSLVEYSFPDKGIKEIYYNGSNYYALINKFENTNIGLIFTEKISSYNRIFYINLITVYLLALSWIVFFRIKFPQRLLFIKENQNILFKRRKFRIRPIIIEHFIELLVFSLVVIIMAHTSFTQYLKYYNESLFVPVTSPKDIQNNPYLTLDTPGYAQINSLIVINLDANYLYKGVNTVSATINYDPQSLSIEGLITDNSICDTIYDNNIDTQQGVVFFSCITKDSKVGLPGSFRLAELKVRVLKDGLTFISFDQPYVKITSQQGFSNLVKQSTEFGESVWGLNQI